MLESTRYTFSKAERLTHKTLIGELFTHGKSFVVYPFRIVWLQTSRQNTPNAQVAISVSKRCFKPAPKRNLLKRRIREIYRTQKEVFYNSIEQKDTQISFMIVYLPRTILSTAEMKPKLQQALQRITKEYEKACSNAKESPTANHDSSH